MKKKAIKMGALLIVILLNIFFWNAIKVDVNRNLTLQVELDTPEDTTVQVFYSVNQQFEEIHSQSNRYEVDKDSLTEFQIPSDTKYLRMDFGEKENDIEIKNLLVDAKGMDVNLLEHCEDIIIQKQMLEMQKTDDALRLKCTGNDPYWVMDVSAYDFQAMLLPYMERDCLIRKCVLCLVFDSICIVLYVALKRIKPLIRKMMESRSLILDLAKNDFKTKYAGSYLGIVWAFVQPVVTILVYWFVFQVGFRSGTTEGVPFVLWLTAGMVPWFFFSEALNSATASLLDYSYLVKKVVFDIEIVPLIRILSALFVHVFFVGFMIVMFLINGVFPAVEWVQVIYYSVCLVLLVVGISYATGALVIFFRDLAQIIIVILQVGMWMTPIMWNLDIIPANLQFIFKLNPLCYIVQGYRDALIYHKWFWDSTYQTVFFWCVVLACLLIGSKVFSKLKIHFADVI